MASNEELVLMIKRGEDAERNLETLFKQNRGLIARLAYRIGDGQEMEDLFQEGYLALMKAVDGWNPEGGASFATYAFKWIRAAMQRYVRYNALIVIPEHRAGEYITLRSLEEETGDGISIGDMIPDAFNGIEDAQERIEREELASVLWGIVDEELDQDEAQVVKLRYQNNLTFEECGAALGVTKSAAQLMEQRAIRIMRGYRTRKRLAPYIEENAYAISLQTGLGTFRRCGTSATEKAAIYLQEQRERQKEMVSR